MRLPEIVQNGLILVFIVLSLSVGSMFATHIFGSVSTDNKYIVVKEEISRSLRTVDDDLKLRIDRIREAYESDSYTKDRRIRLLEEQVDSLERELRLQKQEIESLKSG